MLVNLFDENFRHDVCSVGWATPEHVQYTRDQRSFSGVTLFTDGYVLDGIARGVRSTHKIGWLHEPQCLWPIHYRPENLAQVKSQFDCILTYYQPLLDMEPEFFRFAPYGGIWVDQSEWGVRPKTKQVSMLFGEKQTTDGHKIRHEIYRTLSSKYNIDYYGYAGEPTTYGPHTKLKVLRDYQYSIVIETCREKNLFTEILLDCFVLGTIPIFWGAPNIDLFFDAAGILSFETVAELEHILDHLRPVPTQKMLRAVARNFVTCQRYAVTEDWIYRRYLKEYE
jgi:hypothetical protein